MLPNLHERRNVVLNNARVPRICEVLRNKTVDVTDDFIEVVLREPPNDHQREFIEDNHGTVTPPCAATGRLTVQIPLTKHYPIELIVFNSFAVALCAAMLIVSAQYVWLLV